MEDRLKMGMINGAVAGVILGVISANGSNLGLLYDESAVKGFIIPLIVSVIYGAAGWVILGDRFTSAPPWSGFWVCILGGALVGAFAGTLAIIIANIANWEFSFIRFYKPDISQAFINLMAIWGFSGFLAWGIMNWVDQSF